MHLMTETSSPTLLYRHAVRMLPVAAAAFVLLVAPVAPGTDSKAHARPAPESFADLAEKLLPSVVNISTTQIRKNTGQTPQMPQLPPGSQLEDFFKDFMERQRRQRQRRSTSLGSGFIIDESGLIVTNNHVIDGADEIRVIFHDDTSVKAKVIGRDSKTDLALLQVKTKMKLVAVKWGDSDELRVGDWVLAIGNPFGFGGTVTAGIVSARQRDINSGPYDDYIQTDASINRGNSGGPLFDIDGNVIGVNTAIISPSGGSIGIGFSIPSSLAQPVIAQLREFGKTKRGWLGVRIQTVTDEIAESLGIKKARGALVASVTEGGPAEEAGLKAGDVILELDGKSVREMRRLPRIVAETEIDKAVDVVVWRGGKKVTLQVKIGELKEEKVTKASAPGRKPETGKGQELKTMGMTLSPLSADLKAKYKISEDAKGVLVTDVDGTSLAAEKGLREGDVIVEAGQKEVGSPEEIEAKITEARKSGRKSILLLIQRGGDLRFLALKVDQG